MDPGSRGESSGRINLLHQHRMSMNPPGDTEMSTGDGDRGPPSPATPNPELGSALIALPPDALRTITHLAGPPARQTCHALESAYGPLHGTRPHGLHTPAALRDALSCLAARHPTLRALELTHTGPFLDIQTANHLARCFPSLHHATVRHCCQLCTPLLTPLLSLPLLATLDLRNCCPALTPEMLAAITEGQAAGRLRTLVLDLDPSVTDTDRGALALAELSNLRSLNCLSLNRVAATYLHNRAVMHHIALATALAPPGPPRMLPLPAPANPAPLPPLPQHPPAAAPQQQLLQPPQPPPGAAPQAAPPHPPVPPPFIPEPPGLGLQPFFLPPPAAPPPLNPGNFFDMDNEPLPPPIPFPQPPPQGLLALPPPPAPVDLPNGAGWNDMLPPNFGNAPPPPAPPPPLAPVLTATVMLLEATGGLPHLHTLELHGSFALDDPPNLPPARLFQDVPTPSALLTHHQALTSLTVTLGPATPNPFHYQPGFFGGVLGPPFDNPPRPQPTAMLESIGSLAGHLRHLNITLYATTASDSCLRACLERLESLNSLTLAFHRRPPPLILDVISQNMRALTSLRLAATSPISGFDDPPQVMWLCDLAPTLRVLGLEQGPGFRRSTLEAVGLLRRLTKLRLAQAKGAPICWEVAPPADALHRLRHLKVLQLEGWMLGEWVQSQLWQMTRLTSLRLKRCTNLDQDVLADVCSNLTNLQAFDLTSSTPVGSKQAGLLRKLPHLEELWLSLNDINGISPAALMHLVPPPPLLRRLHLVTQHYYRGISHAGAPREQLRTHTAALEQHGCALLLELASV